MGGLSGKPADLAAYQTCWFVETSGDSIGDIDPVAAPARPQTICPNEGLSAFMLKPKGLQGLDLFAHMLPPGHIAN